MTPAPSALKNKAKRSGRAYRCFNPGQTGFCSQTNYQESTEATQHAEQFSQVQENQPNREMGWGWKWFSVSYPKMCLGIIDQYKCSWLWFQILPKRRNKSCHNKVSKCLFGRDCTNFPAVVFLTLTGRPTFMLHGHKRMCLIYIATYSVISARAFDEC